MNLFLHQSVARGACHTLVQGSAARSAAEPRPSRKVQDVSPNLCLRGALCAPLKHIKNHVQNKP